MPYIDEQARERLADLNDPQTPGELNYVITTLCLLPEPIRSRLHKVKAAVDEYLAQYQQPTYRVYNEIIGAIECARMEHARRTGAVGQVDDLLKYIKNDFYRKRVEPYENDKMKLNGDVF